MYVDKIQTSLLCTEEGFLHGILLSSTTDCLRNFTSNLYVYKWRAFKSGATT